MLKPAMDKLRALEYFATAARERSFSGAARALDVSVPAVARLVTVLERRLGVALFDRSAQGLALTAEGASYLAACTPHLEALAAADERASGAAARAAGTLVVGAPAYLTQHCILPALAPFRARYPEIALDVRACDRIGAAEAKRCEVLVLYGWPERPGLVHRRIAQTRLLVCASPEYWARHGVPARPRDLERYDCLLFRDQEGTALDAWQYQRGAARETATVRGPLVSSHRDDVLEAALAGLGVGRFSDLSIQRELASGRLVPALVDWESKDAPPVNLLYRAHQRRLPRVRAFVEFVQTLFERLEAERVPRFAERVAAERPGWYRRRGARASAGLRGGRATA
jgi:LysR family transcriptional regulator, regulator for bpeEF and oprC